MKRLIIVILLSLSLFSCEKPMVYVYTYHWKEARTSPWNQYNLITDDYLSDGAIEVYRQTEDNKVIERGLTSTGVVWQSYITYCGSRER